MKEDIKKYNERGNLIYRETPNKFKIWYEYDNKDRIIYCKNSSGYEEWREYYGSLMYLKLVNDDEYYDDHNIRNEEHWYKFINNCRTKITKEEFDKIKFRELLNRKRVPRYEILDIYNIK